MSLEITFLDYQIKNIPSEGQEEEEKQFGLLQYDPEEKSLLFYDSYKKKLRFSLEIKDIKLKEDYLHKNIIDFEFIKNKKKYEVSILNQKLDTLCDFSCRYLLDMIQEESLKREKKYEK